MLKPPNGAEFCTKMPTVKVTPNEPDGNAMVSVPFGQLVAVEGLTMHTTACGRTMLIVAP